MDSGHSCIRGFAFGIGGLSVREREVLSGIVVGKSNKMIAHELSISQKTVEGHRGHMMHKMEAASLAELVQMAFSLDLLSVTA